MTQVLDISPLMDELDRMGRVFSDAEREQILRYVAGKVGVKAETVALPAYPPQSGKPLAVFYERQRKDGATYRSKFKSLKQQRYVMALAARGGIPTKRTGKLGQSITSAVTSVSSAEATVAVGTNRTYAPYVIGGEGQQSHYHAGNWPQMEANLIKGQDQLLTTAQDSFVQVTNKLLGEG